MPAAQAVALLAALDTGGVSACVAGGWAVDALLREQTRPHSDLDLWLAAADLEPLFLAFVEEGIDRVHPWPGDRPWNFVLHDGRSRRVDLHLYEDVGGGRLQYGSVLDPFVLGADDVAGQGQIDGVPVRCESPAFALRCRGGYEPRDIDRHDVALLCRRFGMAVPAGYR